MSHESYFKRKPHSEDFKPVSILVFRNGDEYDQGIKVTVTRHRFPHWLHLLEYLTAKLQLTEGPVHHLYDLYQNELLHFKELENDGVYVGAFKKFKQVRYNYKGYNGRSTGSQQHDIINSSHNKRILQPLAEPKSLHSRESYEIYLKNRKFFPATVRDMWDDSMGKRTKTVGTSAIVNHVPRLTQMQTTNDQRTNKLNNLQPYRMISRRSHSEPKMKMADPSIETGYFRNAEDQYSFKTGHEFANQNSVHRKVDSNSRRNMFANQLEEMFHRNATTINEANKQRTVLQNNVNRNVFNKDGNNLTNAHRSTSTEWDSDPLDEKEAATQTVWSVERATNTTASYVKRNKSRAAKVTTKKTADVTVPHWAQQLQDAVSQLSTKVEKLNV